MVARLFADEDASGIPSHQRHHLVRDQPVIDNHIRLLHLAQGVQGEQAGIAGAGTYQDHFSLGGGIIGKQAISELIGGSLVTRAST